MPCFDPTEFGRLLARLTPQELRKVESPEGRGAAGERERHSASGEDNPGAGTVLSGATYQVGGLPLPLGTAAGVRRPFGADRHTPRPEPEAAPA